MSSATPSYLPDGSCRFCQTPTRFGGEAHAPSCPYAAALREITDQRALCVEYAACLVAELRGALEGMLDNPMACSHCNELSEAEEEKAMLAIEHSKSVLKALADTAAAGEGK